MFPETKDILVILLVALAAVLAVIVFLLILKRRQFRRMKAAGPAPEQPAEPGEQSPPEAGGPSDAASIKASIISEGPEAEGAGESAQPKAAIELVEIDESAIQEGVEPGDNMIKPPPELAAGPLRKPKGPPEEPEEGGADGKPQEDADFMEMKEYAEPVKTRKVVRVAPGGGIEIQRPAEPQDRGRPAIPGAAEAVAKAAKAKASQIEKSPKSFQGKTVVLEGSLKLSSSSKNDTWYVIFDDSGSAVVRSASEIPYENSRITARVEKTRLGQVYLDVIRSEKL